MGEYKGKKIAAEQKCSMIELVEEAKASGARTQKACNVLKISIRTYQRWRRKDDKADQRGKHPQKPPHSLSEKEKEAMIEIATSKEFCDLSPTQFVPVLADRGIYIASESSFYRVLREHNLLTHRHKSKPRSNRKPKEKVATAPNQVWSWDITYIRGPVKGQFFYLYLIVDIYSRMVVGWALHDRENSKFASELIIRCCIEQGIDEDQLVLHSDNGGPMKGATMLATLQNLGVIPSFSRPRTSNDNPFSESLFKTLKYRPEYPDYPFVSYESAHYWIQDFVYWYNHEHKHSGINYVSPYERHIGKDIQILNNRRKVYEMAKQKNPARWSGKVRNWTPVEKVKLNAEKHRIKLGMPT